MIQAALLMLGLALDVAPANVVPGPAILRHVEYRDEAERRSFRLDLVAVDPDRTSTIVLDGGEGEHLLRLHADCSVQMRESDDEPDAIETTLASLFALGAQNMNGIDPGETWNESAPDHRTVYHAGRRDGTLLHFSWTRISRPDGIVTAADVDYDVHDVVPTFIRMREDDGTRHVLRLVADSQRAAR